MKFILMGVVAAIQLLSSSTSMAATVIVHPRRDHLPADLARAAADYDRAQIHADKAELERLVADDYVLVNSGAQVQGKKDLILGYIGPGNDLKPFEIVDKVEIVTGDAAVLGGAAVLEGTSDGHPFKAHVRFADVWQKRGGHWRVVFTELTRMP